MKFNKVGENYESTDGKFIIRKSFRKYKVSSVGFSVCEKYKTKVYYLLSGFTDADGNKITYGFNTLKEAKDFVNGGV